jgi:uncharacterized membrane protein YjgN (DUF898 family)
LKKKIDFHEKRDTLQLKEIIKMPIFAVTGLIGFILAIVVLIFFFIACISVEKTKDEAIKSRELLENMNKIMLAYYKRDFNIKPSSEPVSSVPDAE